MHKRIDKKAFLLVLTIIFLLVLVAVGQIFAQPIPNLTSGSPIVMILDNSGSMGKCENYPTCTNNPPYKIDMVKEAIKDTVASPSLSSTKIGLVEVGNWRKLKIAAIDKSGQCEALNPLLEPTLDQGQFTKTLDEVKPNDDGTTPLAYAILKIKSELLKVNNPEWNWSSTNLPVRMLVVTDGDSNCRGRLPFTFCEAVKGYPSNPNYLNLHVDIVGVSKNKLDIKPFNEFVDCSKEIPDVVTFRGVCSNKVDCKRLIENTIPPTIPVPSIPTPTTVATVPAPTTIASIPATVPTPAPSIPFDFCTIRVILSIITFLLVSLFLLVLLRFNFAYLRLGVMQPIVGKYLQPTIDYFSGISKTTLTLVTSLFSIIFMVLQFIPCSLR